MNSLIEKFESGSAMTIWAREKGLNSSTLLYRLKRGWSVERAIETKVVKNG